MEGPDPRIRAFCFARSGYPERMGFPAPQEMLSAAEAKIGRSLPAPLRQRLATDNGGIVHDVHGQEWTLYPVLDTTDRKRLARSAYDIARETASARQWTGFPADAHAIAADGYGNLLVLLPGSDDIEEWDHETGELKPTAIIWATTD